MKVGRNEPCPCGSGQKYKKCCALIEDVPDISLPEDMRTGTRLDAYMELLQVIYMYYQGLLEFDNDRKELKKKVDAFEKDLQPGTEDGVIDGLFMPWLMFDLRFGKSRKTVCERFLEDRMMKKVGEPALSLIGHMSESYATFYEVTDIAQYHVDLVELGTGTLWNVHLLPDSLEHLIRGDIWYTRLVGPTDDAFELSAAYIFPSEDKEVFLNAVGKQVEAARKTMGELVESKKLFRESCKETLEGWAGYMLESGGAIDDDPYDDDMYDDEFPEASIPTLLNTDGEAMRFCRIVFKVHEEEEVRSRLNSSKGLDYDKTNKTWVWFKKGNQQISTFASTSLGTIKISRGRLVAETNSEERAEKLVKKLKKELKDIASFEKMEVKDMDDLPPMSDKERKRREAQQEKLLQDPQARDSARQMAEEYYHKEWLTQPIPALSGQSPLEAVKTPEGKRKVEELVNGLEAMQDRRPDEPFQVDMAGLRARLGL